MRITIEGKQGEGKSKWAREIGADMSLAGYSVVILDGDVERIEALGKLAGQVEIMVVQT